MYLAAHILAIAIQLSAQSQPSPGEITGTIVDKSTQNPIEGCEISLLQMGRSTVPLRSGTNAHGAFEIKRIPDGTYFISPVCKGFIARWIWSKNAKEPGKGFQLDRTAPKISDVLIELERESSITGNVLGSLRVPLAGVEIHALRRTYIVGESQYQPKAAATTDKNGSFRLSGLEPGSYVLYANPSRVQPRVVFESNTTRYVPRYYPGTDDISAATPIDLAGGLSISDLSLRVHEFHTYGISGTLDCKSLNIEPQNALISIRPISPGGSVGPILNSGVPDTTSHRFHLDQHVPGSYRIEVTSTGGNKHTLASQLILLGKRDMEDLAIGTPAIPSSIRASFQSKQPEMLEQLAAAYVLLTSLDLPSQQAISAYLKQTPTRLPSPLGPGRHSISFRKLPRWAYIDSISSQQASASAGVIKIHAESESADLVFHVSDGAATLATQVQTPNRKPAVFAQVLLLPESESALPQIVTTDTDGKADFYNLAPGRYRAIAFDSQGANFAHTPIAFATARSSGTELVIQKSGAHSIRLEAQQH